VGGLAEKPSEVGPTGRSPVSTAMQLTEDKVAFPLGSPESSRSFWELFYLSRGSKGSPFQAAMARLLGR